MKTLLLLTVVSTTLLLATGCADSRANAPATEPVPASTYKAGHGVRLTPAAAQFAGLATAEFTGTLPPAALLRTAKGDFVYVANGDWFLRTPVRVATAPGGGLRVDDGLYEGDVLVTAGVRMLWLAELQAINGGVGCADDN